MLNSLWMRWVRTQADPDGLLQCHAPVWRTRSSGLHRQSRNESRQFAERSSRSKHRQIGSIDR